MSTIFFGTVILMLLALMTTMTNQNVWSRQIMVSYAKKIDNSDVVLEGATSGVSTSGNVTISGHSTKKKRADKRSSTIKSGKGPQRNSIRSRDKSKAATKTTKTKLDTTSDPPDSAVSWLISFPNSGTTYTIHNTEHVSMRSTATNYLSEVHFARSDRIPVKPKADNIANGPWQRNNSLPMPPVVLTKTHCTGYDDRAPMQSSIISTERFLDGCKRTSQYADLYDKTNHSKVKATYDHKDLVVSAIHLIRNPFDNIISRMHHGMKTRHKALGSTDEEIRAFMTSTKGVMSWCDIADRTFWMESEVPKNITNPNKLKRKPWDLNILLSLPCHSELFRYVEWHHAAIRMIEQENLRSMVVYYEDYETQYNETVNSILKFLNLAYEAEDPLPFKTGKTYRDTFFTQEVQEKTRDALEVMASKELWQILRKYFPSTTAADKK